MEPTSFNRTDIRAATVAAGLPPQPRPSAAERDVDSTLGKEIPMSETRTFTRTTPPA
jgi:hypothetical protein